MYYLPVRGWVKEAARKILYRISGFIRWEVIFAFFASDEEFAKIVKLLL